MSSPSPDSGSSPSPDPDSVPQQDSSSKTQDPTQSALQQLFGTLCKQKLLEEVDKLKQAVENDDPQQVIMAVPMLLALTVCPAMLGTQEAIRQSQSKTKREEHRGRRCNLVVSCVKPSIRARDINNKLVVLKDSKLYIANEHPLYNHDSRNGVSRGYPFSGYFLPYPDSTYEGLVSTISDDPPFLNWIYVDKNTYEVKYGVRDQAQPHITGPFDCTKQDRRMTMQGWEGFCAVEELPGIWALYFDCDDDGLKSKVAMGTRVLEIELTRREKKEPKPAPEPDAPTNLEEKMKQHKEHTAKEEAERAHFIATGRHPGAEPPSPRLPMPTADPKTSQMSDTAKLEKIAEAMQRISLTNRANIKDDLKTNAHVSTHTDVHAQNNNHDKSNRNDDTDGHSIVTSFTNDFSVFSAAKKLAEQANSSGSHTAASSVWDRNGDSASVSNGSDDGAYKKPYVEEVADGAAS